MIVSHATTFRLGLMSVTFRARTVAEVIDIAGRANLGSIVWTGDVHVPVGDTARAETVRRACSQASIVVDGYGSYWRADELPFEPTLATAHALGAGDIRIWAGTAAAAAVDEVGRKAIAARVAAFADHAASLGVRLNLEFHRNTLTDSADSTVRLLDEIEELRGSAQLPVASYWQPRPGISTSEAVDKISILGQRLSSIHVFSWAGDGTRLPLEARREQWMAVLAALAPHPPGAQYDQARALLLEFVQADSEAQLMEDAAELHHLLALADTEGA
ncbi:MAG TPA: sugar phosphate isomerase/epimerase [Microbacteriaceae bacterium]